MNNFFNKFIDYLSIFYSKSIPFLFIKNRIVNIDLSSPCNHFGDTILFAPLIAGLINGGYDVRVDDCYGMYSKLFSLNSIDSSGFFIGRSYSAEDRRRIGAEGLINFYSLPSIPIAQSIHNKFLPSSLYKLSLEAVKNSLLNISDPINFAAYLSKLDKPFVLVSSSTNSRPFGFHPNLIETKINFIDAVSTYKMKNFLIVMIGQKSNELSSIERNLSGFIDIDLRGKTQWYDLPFLFMHHNFHSIVTYDTFTFHLATLLDRRVDLFHKSWLSKSEHRWIIQRFIPGF